MDDAGGVIDLADGRQLAYGERGVPDGIPLVSLHGLPGGTHPIGFDPAALEAAGVRVITPARPGFASSTRHAGRTLLDWGRDVGDLADKLGIDRFALAGASAGGPSTVACSAVLGDRLGCVGLICAMGPYFDNPQFDELLSADLQFALPIARENRDATVPLIRAVMEPVCAAAADAEAYFDGPYMAEVSVVDRPLYLHERATIIRSLKQTYGNGVETLVDELSATLGPWEFDLASIVAPVRAWHGDVDTVPFAPIQHVIDQVPDGEITIYPGEGHALSPDHHPDWLAALTAWAR